MNFLEFIKKIFVFETPEEKKLREEWEKRLKEIIEKMKG